RGRNTCRSRAASARRRGRRRWWSANSCPRLHSPGRIVKEADRVGMIAVIDKHALHGGGRLQRLLPTVLAFPNKKDLTRMPPETFGGEGFPCELPKRHECHVESIWKPVPVRSPGRFLRHRCDGPKRALAKATNRNRGRPPGRLLHK